MLSRVMRQRRRIFLGTCGVMLGALLQFGPGLTTQIFGLFALCGGVLVVLFAPRLRHFIEATAFALPFAAALPVDGTMYPAVALLAAILFQRFFSDGSLDGLPLRVALVSTRTADLAAPANEIWTRLIPGESHPEDHWTGTMIDFDRDPEDPSVLNTRYRNADGLFDEVTISFLERDYPHHCRYYIERSEGRAVEEAVMSIRLTELEPGLTRIDSELRHEPMPVRAALHRWLDDAFGDEWDSFNASITNQSDWSLHRLTRDSRPMDEPETAEMIW